MPGRPRVYTSPAEARRAANERAARRAQAAGLVQRSVSLPASTWALIRAAREHGETSDAHTIERVLLSQLAKQES